MQWTVHGIGAAAELRSDWDRINRENRNLPILDCEFFELLLRRFGPASAKLALCTADNRTIAAAVVVRASSGGWTTYQPSQAPLGAWVQLRTVPLGALLDSLRRTLPTPSLLMSATQLDPLMVPRPDDDALLSTLDYMQTASLDLVGSFEEYWRSRGKNMKKNLTRQRNRLAREQIQTRFEVLTSSQAVGSGVDDYGRLESKGWKAKLGTAIHPDNEQGAFYRELMELYAGKGEAFAWRYFYDDVLVATELYLKRAGSIILLKTTHDESQRTTSPGYLLREESTRTLFDEGDVGRIEFYGKVVDWHRRWTDDFRSLYHVNRYGSKLMLHAAAAKKRLLG